MVSRARTRSRLLLVGVLGISASTLGSSSGCLINPKDYPLAGNVAGREQESNAGHGGEVDSVGGRPGSAGKAQQGGGAGLADAGSTTSSSGANGSGETGGTLSEAGGAPLDAGGEGGAPAQAGGPDNQGGLGGSGIAGANTAGSAGQLATGGATATSVKRVFVTSQTFDGDFKAHGATSDSNGLKGASAVCNLAAVSAGLGGTWIAWLSVTGDDAINRVADVAPWYFVDRTTKVFDTHAQLAAPANVPVNMTENGDTVSGAAWTGTTLLGTAQSARCNEWQNTGTTLGAWGDVGSAFDWSYKNTQHCSSEARVYCFEQ